ncbi:uncharacterized protein EI90DRAFT_3046665 [Cantharellus anzutake]|uniref:uncharacterized protein n=1 Tax=Cantharellus anzutake TaxID=1750568 RepID=UPI001905DFDC|nr:uncharacterized protein EI90DRAFT_3046665 [Cantharellus anzutake]KAF8336654.1 hypothetical protein EI90DRAFT_3046665 [Cantharellus anzutake]
MGSPRNDDDSAVRRPLYKQQTNPFARTCVGVDWTSGSIYYYEVIEAGVLPTSGGHWRCRKRG